MAWSIATLDDLKVWQPQTAASAANDEGYNAALAAATEQIQTRTGRVLKKQSITEWFSGVDAHGRNGEILHLSQAIAPLDPAQTITITEDGVALTVATTFDTSKDCIIDTGRSLTVPTRPRLIRQNVVPVNTVGPPATLMPASWSRGYRNISVTWTGGYADGSLPPSLVQLCCYLAWMMWQEGRQAQTASRSAGGQSRSVYRDMPKWAQDILDAWTIR